MSYYLLGKSKKSAWPWLTEYPITQPHGVSGEMGVDLGMPVGTPITALFGGKVVGAGYYGGGGVVSVETRYHGQPAVFYYQHLDLINSSIQVGHTLAALDVVGWSGGQLSGGHHPANSKFSSGPHIEVGFNPPWGGMWNPRNYGPNIDPEPFLRSLAQGGVGSSLGLGSTGAQVGYVLARAVSPTGFGPIAEAVDDALAVYPVPTSLNPADYARAAFQNTGPVLARMTVAGLGFLLVAGTVLYLLREPVEDATAEAAKFGGQAVGAAAVLA